VVGDTEPFSCSDPLLEHLLATLELAEIGQDRTEVAVGTGAFHGVDRNADRQALLEILEAAYISGLDARRPDVVEDESATLLVPAELLEHRKSFPPEPDRSFRFAGEHLEAGDIGRDIGLGERRGAVPHESDGSVEAFESSVALAQEPEVLAQQFLRLGRAFWVAGVEQGVAGLLEDISRTAALYPLGDSAKTQQKLRAAGIFRGPEVESAGVELQRRSKCAEGVRSVARFAQPQAGAFCQLLCLDARRLVELEGGQVMVRKHLGVVVGATQ
jgi:hypothetical protein